MMKKREEEILKEAWEYFHETLKKLDFVKCSPMDDWTDGLVRGFIKGANWADKHPRIFKGQTDKMEEREIAFMDWWLENHQGESPTFADAIAWADKTMIDKACEWLGNTDMNNFEELEDDGNYYFSYERFINAFKKATGLDIY